MKRGKEKGGVFKSKSREVEEQPEPKPEAKPEPSAKPKQIQAIWFKTKVPRPGSRDATEGSAIASDQKLIEPVWVTEGILEAVKITDANVKGEVVVLRDNIAALVWG